MNKSPTPHVVSRVPGTDAFTYRGIKFEVNRTARGKKGCYKTLGGEGITAVTRKQLIAAIDRYRYQAPTCSCWCPQ